MPINSYVTRGFHGTTRESAESILTNNTFFRSSNSWDWLGQGTYFFDNGPLHAWKFALSCSDGDPEKAAVVSVDIRLENCLDLLDKTYWRFVREQFETIREQHDIDKKRLPKQRGLIETFISPDHKSNGKNELDQMVIEDLICTLEGKGEVIDSTRAAFAFKDRIFTSSFFGYEDHIQIAVRRPAPIYGNKLELEMSEELHAAYMESNLGIS